MRFATLTFLAVLALPGCGLICGGLDNAAAIQNEANVAQIVGENESYLAAENKPESLKAVQRDRNEAALGLARAMAGASR